MNSMAPALRRSTTLRIASVGLAVSVGSLLLCLWNGFYRDHWSILAAIPAAMATASLLLLLAVELHIPRT
jgi:hypothetical protein